MMPATPHIGFFVERHFLKDLSFENPAGPVSMEETPTVNVQVGGNVLSRSSDGKDSYVVETTLTITGRDPQKTRFICELTYVADVLLKNIPEPVREQTLSVDVPKFLIAHINDVIDHAGRAGGLPGLKVEKIDFLKLNKLATARRAAASH
jgi:preprotein translocase subunit SecB